MNYKIATTFIAMCLAWGFSWFAVKMQAGSNVPLEISLFYRFLLTSILMFIIAKASKHRLYCYKKEIAYFITIGITNFSLNFLLIYYAVKHIASGVSAVIFSLSIIISEIISSFVNKRKISKRVIISSIIGTIGLTAFILPLINFNNQQYNDNIKGLIQYNKENEAKELLLVQKKK